MCDDQCRKNSTFNVYNNVYILQVIDYGNNARSKGATGVNPDSSRSHAVLQLEVRNSSDKRVGRYFYKHYL